MLFSLDWWTMGFGKRLAVLRKERSMTQQTLADEVGCHVTMVRRYEANETQPTLEVIRNMARALSVSADTLVFDEKERDPTDELRLQFEAVSQLPLDEQAVVKDVLESLLLKYQARRWEEARQAAAAAATPAKKATPKRSAHATAR
jgi:transcriptional regulator with XRE-family HTH domain